MRDENKYLQYDLASFQSNQLLNDWFCSERYAEGCCASSDVDVIFY